MRYPAAEKLEIIRLVEQSHLPVRRVLEQIGVRRRSDGSAWGKGGSGLCSSTQSMMALEPWNDALGILEHQHESARPL
jgi:hypothetical protein